MLQLPNFSSSIDVKNVGNDNNCSFFSLYMYY